MIDSVKQSLTWWRIQTMQATNLEDVDFPDILALDKEGQIILIAEVKGFPLKFQGTKAQEYATLRLIDYLQAAKIAIPFAMLIDVDKIQILKWDGNNLSKPIVCFNTADVLSHYEPKFCDKRIFSLYLKGLTEAWLRDLAYHWKSGTPPFTKEMAQIGLLQLVEDGTTEIY